MRIAYIADWTKLAEILKTTTQAYQEKPGFFSGKQGRERAENILSELSKMSPEANQKDFILLTYAICFQSSSDTLKYRMMDKVIPQNWIPNGKDGMSCSVFNTLLFDNAYAMVHNAMRKKAGIGQVPDPVTQQDVLKQLLILAYDRFTDNSALPLDEAAKKYKFVVEPKTQGFSLFSSKPKSRKPEAAEPSAMEMK